MSEFLTTIPQVAIDVAIGEVSQRMPGFIEEIGIHGEVERDAFARRVDYDAQFGRDGLDLERVIGQSYAEDVATRYSKVQILTRKYGQKRDLDIEEIESYKRQMTSAESLMNAETERLLRSCKTQRDLAAATALFAGPAGGWGYTAALAGGVRWDTDDGKPLDDLNTMKDEIESLGASPNVLLIDKKVWNTGIKRNAQILSAFNSNRDAGYVSMDVFKEIVAGALDIERVILIETLRNASGDPAARELARIAEGKVFMGQVALSGASAVGNTVTGAEASAFVVTSLPGYGAGRVRVKPVDIGERILVDVSGTLTPIDARLGATLTTVIG